MNDLVFIKDVIYSLKREYGFPLRIGNSTLVSKNLETGHQEIQNSQVYVHQAVQLPNQISFDFMAKIAQPKAAAIYSGSFVILLEKTDLKGLIPVVGKTWAIYKQTRVELLSADDFEHAWLLRVRNLPGMQLPITELKQTLTMTDHYGS